MYPRVDVSARRRGRADTSTGSVRSIEWAVLGEPSAVESQPGEALAWRDPWPDLVGDTEHIDLVALAASFVIKGQGTRGYLSALDAAARL